MKNLCSKNDNILMKEIEDDTNNGKIYQTSQVAQKWRTCLLSRRHEFGPWVRKIPWRKKWQLILVFLPGKSHGQGNLVGYSHRVTKSDMTYWLNSSSRSIPCSWIWGINIFKMSILLKAVPIKISMTIFRELENIVL